MLSEVQNHSIAESENKATSSTQSVNMTRYA